MPETIHRGGNRRGNPNWGKPDPYGLRPAEPTAWEKFLASRGIPEERAHYYPSARQWVKKHQNTNYIPEEVLRRCGLEIPFEERFDASEVAET